MDERSNFDKLLTRINAKHTEWSYRLIKRLIKLKVITYPYRFYLRKIGHNKREIDFFFTIFELRINRIISNAMSDSKQN
jgi:hypothetical protein